MANIATNDFFGLAAEDLNGECFIVGGEGEIETLIENNYVYFPHGFPAAANGDLLNVGEPSTQQANEFILVNAHHSVIAGRSVQDAAKIAYIRFLAARNGLMSPLFDRQTNFVRYNHAIRLTDTETTTVVEAAVAVDGLVGAIKNTLSVVLRKKFREMFSDMVCCVAYMFRVRGHHYKADFQERYVSLWSRCLHAETDLNMQWEHIATDALHAIMPVHLDQYWSHCVANSQCAGTLAKRYDSAPAGVAGVLALARGMNDVQMLFPGVFTRVPEAYDLFSQLVDRLQESRWGGSVNSRYYGANRIRFDENQIGALASVVMGVYENLAPDSALKNSPALRRLAQTAPVTGGAIGLAARRTVQNESMNLIGDIPAARAQGQIQGTP